MFRSVFGQRAFSSLSMLKSLNQKTIGSAAARGPGRQFSQSTHARDASHYMVPKPEFKEPLILPIEKRPNVMKVIERESLARANVDGRARLFKRKGPRKDLMRPGDVVYVETANNLSKADAGTSVFTGVCIGIYRRGIDTSFVLRNAVQRVGVEMRIMAYSPLVKNIEVIQKGENHMRAKLYYIRGQSPRSIPLKYPAHLAAKKTAASAKKAQN